MILNRQRAVVVSLPPLRQFLEHVRRTLHLPKDSVTVCLLSDAEMARLNRRHRGKGNATDVLSFPAGDGAGKTTQRSAYRGDVAIAPGVAGRNARRFGRTLPGELRILILHGVLHLMGYDHETDDGEMERYEAGLRRRLGLS